MKFIKYILRLFKLPLLLAFIASALFFAFKHFNIGESISNLFKKKPLIIDNTPLVITEVKNIAELQTVQLYAEIVTDSTIITDMGIANNALRSIGMVTLPINEQRKLVLIVKGKVIAGIDLKLLNNDKIFVHNDSVSITLPAASYLDIITNPSDIETFLEQGKWTGEEVQAVKNKARRELMQKAAAQQLLQQAAGQSATAIEQMLRLYGFAKVTIIKSGI
jgi:hypothetical protein